VDYDLQFANPDEELAERFLGSPDSYREAFAERCDVLLRKYVRRLVYAEDRGPNSANKETFTEDAYSLALSKFVPALRQLKCARALHSWLWMIARSAVVEETTSRTRRTRIPIRFESLDDLISRAAEEPRAARELGALEAAIATYQSCHWHDPETVAIQNERQDILRKIYDEHCTASNKGAECGVIVAHIYSDEMTIRQIAGVLGRKKSTVHDIFHDNMTAYREMYTRVVDGKTAHCKGSAL
jgi:RNA polymerase sigma factor (sigma-70 family)